MTSEPGLTGGEAANSSQESEIRGQKMHGIAPPRIWNGVNFMTFIIAEAPRI